ncbi:MAG: HAMP domain-containing histidine kinase [Planctomycetes bacterium]|nr:HAMP domain-containing histidine kinase [Planctomycetota bacterium]
MTYQLWRSWQLEGQLERSDYGRSRLLAERILQRATTSVEVFAAVPNALRVEVRGGRVVVDERVGWIDVDDEADRDPVVLDRLDRAARAEFAARDQDEARRQFDELLSGPLVFAQRLRVLAAGAWQARRAGDEQRGELLRGQLDEALQEVRPAQLASPTVAAAVAAGARLGVLDDDERELLTFLPAVTFAALDADEATARRHRERVQLRERCRLADACLDRVGERAPAGLHAIDARHVLWLMPIEAGARRAAVLEPSAWFAALQAAAAAGAPFEWPRRVQPVLSDPTAAAPFGVAGVADLVPAVTADGAARTGLLPALTGVLALAFAFVFFQQRRAARREEQAIAQQAQFLTTVTHELKTPLAGIRLLGEMLAEGRANGREREYYELLVGESARLSMLIDNVLDLGRLEAGQRSYTLQPWPIADVVRETLRMLVPVLQRDGVEVTFDETIGDAVARIDRDAFVQALVAVLDNARKYGARGGRVEVRAWLDAGRPRVAVRDHGDGVPEAERERVFDRFVRGDAHAHGSTPGVGIGLYLARSIVRRLGGELACVAPDDGAGAEFRFTLLGESTA